jgi:hypothetical protein
MAEQQHRTLPQKPVFETVAGFHRSAFVILRRRTLKILGIAG